MKPILYTHLICRPWGLAALLGLGLGHSAQAQTPSLYVAGSGTLYQGSSIYSSGSVQNEGLYVPAAGTLLLNSGNFANTGTGTIASGTFINATLRMAESAAGTSRTINLGGEAVPNLTLDAPGNTVLGSGGSVKGVVNLVQGHLITSPSASSDYSLILGATGTLAGETDAHYVKGRVAQARNLSGSGPIDFGNMGVTVNPAGFSFPLTIERRAGLAWAGVTYGTNPNMASFQGIDRIWAFSSTTPTVPSAAVTFSWLPADDHGLTFAGTNAQVWRSDDFGTTWLKQGGVQDGSSRTVSAIITKLTSLYTVSTVASPLPVQLVALTAAKQAADGLVSWKTASEANSSFFELQASLDGTSWQVLGQRPAAGTTTTAHTYTYLDQNLARYTAPLVYYRLRCVDLDQSARYSPIVTLDVAPAAWELAAYPNPFALELTAQLRTAEAGPVSLSLLDAAGRVVLRRTQVVEQPGSQLIALDEARSLPAGTYMLLVQQNAHKAARRLVRK